MVYVRLAELTVCIENRYPYIETLCKEYLTDDTEADFSVCVTEQEIAREGEGVSPGYLESLAVYRKIAERLLSYQGFLMHGVVMEVEEQGVALLAKSGTGKSTHAQLWKELLGDQMTVINGDKPLIRLIDGQVFAYGTPWAGKEQMHTNKRVPLTKLCFLERSETNECIALEQRFVLEKLISQVYRPKNGLIQVLDLLEQVIQKTEGFLIRCNREVSAAEIAYKGIWE